MKLKLKLSQNAAQKSYNISYIKLKIITKKEKEKKAKLKINILDKYKNTSIVKKLGGKFMFCDNLSFSFILLIIQIKQFHVYVVKKEL
jgi:hypothetical protein